MQETYKGLGKQPTAPDHIRAVPGARELMCKHSYAGYGACTRPTGHEGYHQDVNDYSWELIELEAVTTVERLTPGDRFWFVNCGSLVGPFTVERLTGARTPDHIIARGPSGLFEQYTPYTVYIEAGAR